MVEQNSDLSALEAAESAAAGGDGGDVFEGQNINDTGNKNENERQENLNDTNNDNNASDNNNNEAKENIKTTFPDNWQELMAGDDEKVLSALSKYSSPAAVAKALKAAQNKLSERMQIAKPDENASEEDLKVWRDAWGIPATPKDYNVYDKFENEIGDNDKEIVDSFLDKMHKNHATPEVVDAALETWQELKHKQWQEFEANNKAHQEACEEDLRAEYGRNYKDNTARALTHIEKTFGAEGAAAIKEAIGQDGRMLINNPDIMRVFVNMALDDNPRATLPKGAQSVEGMLAEKQKIQDAMRTGKYDTDTSMQTRYREILEAESKMSRK